MKFKKLLYVFICVAVLAIAGCTKSPERLAQERKEKIEAAVTRAQTLMFEEKLQDAITLLDSVYKQYGDDSKLCETLAYAYSQNDNYALSALYFEKAAGLKDADISLYLFAARAYERANINDAAIRTYEQYLASEKSDFMAWKSLGKCYETALRYQDALNAYLASLKAADRNPNTEEAAAIGVLFMKLGNKTQAIRWLEPALAATSKDNLETRKTILIALIDLYLADKNTAKLDAAVKQLEEIDPAAIDALHPNLKAQLAEFRKKLEEAKEAIRKQEELKKAQEERIKKEAEEKAKKEAEEKAKLEAEKAEAAKAAQGASQGETVVQGEALKDVASLPIADDAASYIARTSKLIDEGKPADAAKAAHKAILKDPESYETWRALAKAYEAEDKPMDAYLAARESLNRNREDLNTNLYFLRCAAKVLPTDKMLDALYESHQRFPYNSEIIIGLARTYKLSGNRRNAAFFYRKYLLEAKEDHPYRAEAEAEFAAFEAGQTPQTK